MSKEERRESPAGYHYYSSYRDCPRHFHLAYGLGLKPVFTSPPLIFGGAIHEALAAYYTCPSDYDPADRCVLTFEQNMNSRMMEYEDREKWSNDFKRGSAMLTQWITTWSDYDEANYEVLGVEETYKIPFGPPGEEMLFTVRLDRIYKDKTSGNVYVVESKTTGWGVMKMFENTARGDQITAQIWALSKAHPEWHCNSAIIDVLYNRGKVFQCERPGPTVYKTKDALRIFEMGMYSTIVEITQKIKALQGGTPWPLLFQPHKNYCRLFGCSYDCLCDTNVQAGECPPGFQRDPWITQEALEALKKAQSWQLKDWKLEENKE